MKRFVAFALVGLLLPATSGCGGKGENVPENATTEEPSLLSLVGLGPSKAETLTRTLISQVNELADALEKKESPDKINAVAAKLKATGDAMRGMKLPKAEEEKLKTKYEAELKAVMERLMKAAMSNPEGAKAIAALGG
jgi:hypothetical protein